MLLNLLSLCWPKFFSMSFGLRLMSECSFNTLQRTIKTNCPFSSPRSPSPPVTPEDPPIRPPSGGGDPVNPCMGGRVDTVVTTSYNDVIELDEYVKKSKIIISVIIIFLL